MNEKKETFNYTYSASQQAEIKRIREKYAPPMPEEDKMEKLHRLDQSTTKAGAIISLIVGIISTLMLGIGMCCSMLWGGNLFIPGIIIGIIGIAGIVSVYPIFASVTKRRRKKLAPEILRLSDELMKGQADER